MKIYVYAISKNEEKFVNRWCDSMSEADGIFVLDTGSEDNTVELLKKRGCTVESKIINPWRFDDARNESLKMVPGDGDVLVCCDIDEYFIKGWRDILEKNWVRGSTTGRYEYMWNFNPDGSDGVKFLCEKIHSYGSCKWIHPVHEILEYHVPKVFCNIPIRLEHHADDTKSRASYLPLLEMSVEESPQDDRNMHYLGREYMFYKRYEDAITTLKRHLELPDAIWNEERCASMRYIFSCYSSLGDEKNAEIWALKACCEAPDTREPWIQLSEHYAAARNFSGSLYAAEKALSIKKASLSYICLPGAWGYRPYDLAAVAAYYIDNGKKCIEYGKIALDMNPEIERLSKNMSWYENKR